MLSAMSSLTSMQRNFAGYILLQGGLGVLPQKFVDFGAFKECILVLFWVALNKYPYPHPFKKCSLQIYTDLKDGPGSCKKVWNQTKVWRFWSLFLQNDTNHLVVLLERIRYCIKVQVWHILSTKIAASYLITLCIVYGRLSNDMFYNHGGFIMQPPSIQPHLFQNMPWRWCVDHW